MRISKTVSMRSKKKYLVDKVNINCYVKVHLPNVSAEDYRLAKKKHLKVKDLGYQKNISRYYSFNVNLDIHNFYRSKYEKPSAVGPDEFIAGGNVIPLWLLRKMKSDGVTYSSMRRRGLKGLWRYIQRAKKEFAEDVSAVLRVQVRPSEVEVSLGAIEVCFDLPVLSGVDLTKNPEIVRRWNQVVHLDVEKSVFDGLNRRGAGAYAFLGEGATQTPYLRGKTTDKILCRVYTKYRSNVGDIWRFECVFQGSKVIRSHSRSNTVESYEDIKAIVDPLGFKTFERVYAVLAVASPMDDLAKKEIFLKQCRNHCGKHAHDISQVIEQYGCIYTTAINENINQRAIRKAVELCRKGVLFRRSKRGVLKVDWVWLMKNPMSHV